ncbi:MAG: response regulator [Bryobacteraceae bacterium]
MLLLESDLDDAALFKEALTELEERQYGQTWMRAETVHAVDLSEALCVLADGRFDVMLADPNLPDATPLHCFLELSSAAPRTPIIVLAAPEEEALAARLIREGAQDFLLKTEVDCAPLARSIRNAIERHRVCAALRSTAFLDDLTRVYNLTGFCAAAEHDLKLATRLGRDVLLVTADLQTCSPEDADLALIEAGDRLRHAAGDTSLMGRIGAKRFGILIFDLPGDEASRALNRLEQAAGSFNAGRSESLSLAVSRFDPSNPALFNNLLEPQTEDSRQTAFV